MNNLPWATPFTSLTAGTVLSATQSLGAFGPIHFDEAATYICSGDGYARRVVTEDDARANGLNFIFTGALCQNIHLAPRKLRRRGTAECMSCRRQAKRRARLKKQDSPNQNLR